MHKQIVGSNKSANAHSLQLVVRLAELLKGEGPPSALLCTKPLLYCCISWVVRVTGTGHNIEARLGVTLDYANKSTQAYPEPS